MTIPDWYIVLTRDGTVLDATDGAPRSWAGTRLADRDDVPEDLKRAGREALDSARHVASPSAMSLAAPRLPDTVRLGIVDAVPLRRVTVNIRDLLRSNLEALRRQAEASDVTLNVQVDEDVPVATSLDWSKIAWSITALVGNALRYVRRGSQTMPGGSIGVHATYQAASREIVIEVQDDGPGIPAARLQRLFSDRPESPSIALGLMIVRDVVAAHGGTLSIVSDTTAFSSGTIVRFTLPFAV